MRVRLLRLAKLAGPFALLGLGACESGTDLQDFFFIGPVHGGVDLEITGSTPATGDGQLSGDTVAVGTLNHPSELGHPALTEVRAATPGGYLQRYVEIWFETANGTPWSVTYQWGAGANVVRCFNACAGVAVDRQARTISLTNTALDDGTPTAGATKFATLNGTVRYP